MAKQTAGGQGTQGGSPGSHGPIRPGDAGPLVDPLNDYTGLTIDERLDEIIGGNYRADDLRFLAERIKELRDRR